MRKIVTLLIMALLMAGATDVDAKVNKRQTKKKRQTTTATTKTRSRQAPQQILPPQREITDDMINKWQADQNNTCSYVYVDVRKLLEKARNGDPKQQYGVALHWGTGTFGEEDHDEALRWYYLAAQQGHAESEYQVAQAYDKSIKWYNLKRNNFEAAKWYARSIAHGNKDAEFDLGLLLESGYITNEEFRIANELAHNDVDEVKQKALAANKEVSESLKKEKKYRKFYGEWNSAHGTHLIIKSGPRVIIDGVGFKGEWTSDGKLHVDFMPLVDARLDLRYYDGFLYDGKGRMYWRIGQ